MFPSCCVTTQSKLFRKTSVHVSPGGFGGFIRPVPLTVTGNLRRELFSWPITSHREQESHCANIYRAELANVLQLYM